SLVRRLPRAQGAFRRRHAISVVHRGADVARRLSVGARPRVLARATGDLVQLAAGHDRSLALAAAGLSSRQHGWRDDDEGRAWHGWRHPGVWRLRVAALSGTRLPGCVVADDASDGRAAVVARAGVHPTSGPRRHL